MSVFPGDLPLSTEVVRQHKLTQEEYQRVVAHTADLATGADHRDGVSHLPAICPLVLISVEVHA
jgi:hypothetical protein